MTSSGVEQSVRRVALAALLSSACERRAPPAPRPRITPTASVHAIEAPRPAARPALAAAHAPTPDADRCTPPPPPAVAGHWTLVGYRPGPALQHLVAAGRHGAVLVASTTRDVCRSDDGGATWRSVLDAGRALERPVPVSLPEADALVVVAQGTAAEPKPATVLVSRDEGARWEPLALPVGADATTRVHADGARTLWARSGTRLWWSDDARTWQGPRTVPGARVDVFDACVGVLVARIERAGERYFHRSEDGGATWRPLRLGHLGINGGDGVVRCLGDRDGLEAGPGSLPTHWSRDRGRTWQRARYDERARAAARASADDPRELVDAPRCAAVEASLACVSPRRIVLDVESERAREIVAPGACDRVRALDDHRLAAFGPSCGLFLSNDRGGVWRRVATAMDEARARKLGAPGSGGFVSASLVWRVDDGLWWSDDGGARWRPTLTQGTRPLATGVFTDRRRGVFVRDDGWVVSTRDGGEAWQWVLHEELERLASAGSWLMLTTASRVRVSPDGGVTWRASLAFPANLRLDPTLQVSGDRRWIDVTPTTRVIQTGRRLELRAQGDAPQEVARDLPAGWDLLAAHATNGYVDRVLLTGGAVLHHDPAHENLPRISVSARRRHRP